MNVAVRFLLLGGNAPDEEIRKGCPHEHFDFTTCLMNLLRAESALGAYMRASSYIYIYIQLHVRTFTILPMCRGYFIPGGAPGDGNGSIIRGYVS